MNPADAIYSAARYLQAAGIQKDVRRGLWAYNPLASYVNMVLSIAARLPADYGETAGSTSELEQLAWRACPPSSSQVSSSRTTCAAVRGPGVLASSCTSGTGSRSCCRHARRRTPPRSSYACTVRGCSRGSPSDPRRRSPLADGTEIPWRGGTLVVRVRAGSGRARLTERELIVSVADPDDHAAVRSAIDRVARREARRLLDHRGRRGGGGARRPAHRDLDPRSAHPLGQLYVDGTALLLVAPRARAARRCCATSPCTRSATCSSRTTSRRSGRSSIACCRAGAPSACGCRRHGPELRF